MTAPTSIPLGGTPPYALDQVGFSLPALAAAGSAAEGAEREMALAAYMVARLAIGTLPPVALPPTERAMRAERARQWVSALTISGPARMAILRAIDSMMAGGVEAAGAMRELMQLLKGHVNDSALAELGALAERLRLYYEKTL